VKFAAVSVMAWAKANIELPVNNNVGISFLYIKENLDQLKIG
jgi:hypothetical protein